MRLRCFLQGVHTNAVTHPQTRIHSRGVVNIHSHVARALSSSPLFWNGSFLIRTAWRKAIESGVMYQVQSLGPAIQSALAVIPRERLHLTVDVLALVVTLRLCLSRLQLNVVAVEARLFDAAGPDGDRAAGHPRPAPLEVPLRPATAGEVVLVPSASPPIQPSPAVALVQPTSPAVATANPPTTPPPPVALPPRVPPSPPVAPPVPVPVPAPKPSTPVPVAAPGTIPVHESSPVVPLPRVRPAAPVGDATPAQQLARSPYKLRTNEVSVEADDAAPGWLLAALTDDIGGSPQRRSPSRHSLTRRSSPIRNSPARASPTRASPARASPSHPPVGHSPLRSASGARKASIARQAIREPSQSASPQQCAEDCVAASMERLLSADNWLAGLCDEARAVEAAWHQTLSAAQVRVRTELPRAHPNRYLHPNPSLSPNPDLDSHLTLSPNHHPRPHPVPRTAHERHGSHPLWPLQSCFPDRSVPVRWLRQAAVYVGAQVPVGSRLARVLRQPARRART